MKITEEFQKKCTPVVHLNGNSKESLLEEWKNFREALDEALLKFPHESFHGRNHYVKNGSTNYVPSAEETSYNCKMDIMEDLVGIHNLAQNIILDIDAQ